MAPADHFAKAPRPLLHSVNVRFTAQGRFIRDAQGRARLFRGVNVSGRAKLPPFMPFAEEAKLEPLQAWGFNAIRLLVLWEGLEPARGEVDEAYLERMVELAEAAGRRGIYVLVDLHQDLFSRAFGGDGAPPWVTGKTKLSPADRSWFFRYLHPTVRRFQDRFWGDHDGWQSAFLKTLRRVFERFADVDNVIGYDPWNEPMAGLRSMATGRFERQLLPAFYRRCATLRDEVDPGRLLFVEPPASTALGQPVRLPPLDLPGIVYAPHAYDSGALGIGRYVPRLSTFPRTMAAHLDVAQRMDCPTLVGEFGVLNWLRNGREMLEHECSFFDRRFLSWTAWHYNPTDVDWNDEGASIVDADGTERPWMGPLVRPVPGAIAGEPLALDSRAGKTWTLRYRPNGATTEIVVPPQWGGSSVAVEVVGGESDWDGPRLQIRATGRDEVTVMLYRAQTS